MTTTNETKRKAVITANITGNVLKLEFSDGRSLLFDAMVQTPPTIREHAMMHGFKQKLVDAAAISRNPETGKPATVEDKYQAVKTVYDRLLIGEWNAAREGGGNGGLLFQALVRMYDGRKTPEEIKAYLDARTDADKTALRKNPKVAAIIETIRAESGKGGGIDSDELLDALDND